MASMDVDFVLVSEDESNDESCLYVDEEEEEDDSDSDPTFDLDATERAFSNLSVKKTTRRMAEKQEDEGDSKSFEAVEKLIKGTLSAQEKLPNKSLQYRIWLTGELKPDIDGKLDKLKIDHCKVYLKQHGLRRTGKKDILLNRIKEHLELKDGSGEKKYPVSSFTLNCQGDACMGDVVIFEQTVYEMFSIASRSATGPPLGKRIVAGRIVHESYGEAKQQHTFTIEVLWSKGMKPWPPLHPLLIKGRNLYKLKTMRQKWDNEEERSNILREKHIRGHVARLSREKRIQEKELKKEQRGNRKMEKSHAIKSSQPIPNFHDVTNLTSYEQPCGNFTRGMHAHIQRHTPTGHNLEFMLASGSQQNAMVQPQIVQSKPQTRPSHSLAYPNNGYSVQATGRNGFVSGSMHQQSYGYNRQVQQQNPGWGPQRQVNHGYTAHGPSHNERRYPPPVPTQQCRYYLQGRCRYGPVCKFKHE